jgi:RHH-type transcriptional regulator, rel operon repressor / antitoxin RelB
MLQMKTGAAMTKTMISARVDAELNEKLEALAASTQRSKAFLINEAIDALVQREAWLEERIADAVKIADNSEEWISHEAMEKWVNSLDSDNPLPPPEPDVLRPMKKLSA